MSFTRRLDNLERAREARIRAVRKAAIQTIDDWIAANATKVGQDASERVLLHTPVSDSALALVGLSRAEAEAILAEVCQLATNDIAVADAMWSCMPTEIIDAMNDAYTTRLPSDPAVDAAH